MTPDRHNAELGLSGIRILNRSGRGRRLAESALEQEKASYTRSSRLKLLVTPKMFEGTT